MDDVRLGAAIRVIRSRKRLRQIDVAQRARVSRETVARLEKGEMGRLPLDTTRAVTTALGMRIDVRARWRGGELDRVVNARHAALHKSLVRHLQSLPGWIWRPEVSFSVYGERGVIDILAWHAASRSLLIIELKTALIDPQELTATMDRRVRLGRQIGAEQGWDSLTVSAWVIFADTRTNHRRVQRHSAILRTAFPGDGHTMRSWLLRPNERVSALSFWTEVASRQHPPASGQPKRVQESAAAVHLGLGERGRSADQS